MPVFAIIESGVVSNVVLADAYPGAVDVTDVVPRPSIGWLFGVDGFAPPAPVLPAIEYTPLMTQEAFVSRLDFMTEFVPVNAARRTDDVVDAAFVRLYGARNVDVRLPLAQALLGLLVMKGLLAAERVPTLLQPIPLTSPGAIDPRTGAITPEPFE